ncbi:MAG: hypothetical protein ACXVFM_12585 [Solirubrobacteraceae bacterium]
MLALLVALALPAAALADPPWSPTQDLSSPHLFVDPVDVTASGDGTALAWWRWEDGIGSNAASSATVSSRPPGGAFGPERAAPAGVQDIQAFAQTRAVALTARAPRLTAPTRLAVAFGSTSGTFGSERRIVDERSLGGIPQLAVDAKGDAAIAYFRNLGTTNDRVMVSLRRAGGSFGAPFQIAHGRIRSVAVAVGPRGDVLVAWDARGTIQARYKGPGSAGFQPIETVSSDPTFFARIEAAVTDGGRCYLAWSAKFRSEGGSTGPVFNEVAVRPSGHRFRAAQLLEREPDSREQGLVALALTGTRDASVAWTGFDGANARVRVASTDPSARFGAPQEVSPAGRDGVVSDLAAAGGTRLVAWDNGSFDANQVFSALAPPGAPFGAAEAVSAAQEARAAQAIVTPVPTLVWTNRPAGSHPPGGVGAVQTFAQAATRTG